MNFISSSSILAVMPEMIVNLPFLGLIDVRPYIAGAVVFIGLTILFKLLQVVVLNRLESLSARTSTDLDDTVVKAVRSVKPWVYSVVSLYAALSLFSVPDLISSIVTAVTLFAVVWQAIEVASCLVTYAARRFLEKDEDGDGEVDPNAATAAHLVTMIAKIGLWAFGGIFVLSNLGIEVTSLIAGLGIGGIAIAFALQGVLSDLFASFSIYADKPFRIGDFVVIGNDSGTVEKIGIKTTRLKTLQGEELVVSNAELTTARVQNFKKMQERRISAQFGIAYETAQPLVEEVNDMVRGIFSHIEGARLDRVHFTTFGDSALIYEVVYYIESAAYADYLDRQQQFNFELMRLFADKGIAFAYPTQMIYHKVV